MKRVALTCLTIVVLAFSLYLVLENYHAEWAGVDETVVEKFAEAANRPPAEPLINTDQGDLLLFFFLIAGTAGGFVGGYYFRELFPPNAKG